MKRISDETGIEAGGRNVGRFFLAAIPLVLGVGATVWFGLWVSGYEFQQKKEAAKHEATQTQRAAVYVGATVKPTGKLAVEMLPKSCFHIVRADIDTSVVKYNHFPDDRYFSVLLYGQNTCGYTLDYISWHWETVSPNGTLLKSGYTNQCPIPQSTEIAECSFKFEQDDRVEKLRVWGQERP